MTRRVLAAAGAALLLACWAAAAPPADDDVQDVVLQADGRSVLVRLHLQVDGKPFRTAYREAWDDYLKRFFKYLDADGDGVLSEKEASRMPPPVDLIPDPSTRTVNVAFNVRVVDDDGDGKITFAELGTFQRQYGLAPLQIHTAPRFGGVPSGLNEALFARLDTDKDARLTKEELAAAVDVLFALDRDRDDLLTAQELLGAPTPPAFPPRPLGGGGMAAARPAAPSPIALAGDDSRDGAPAVELIVRLGKIGDAKPVEVLSAAGKTEAVSARLAPDGALQLTAGTTMFELRVNAGRPVQPAGARQAVLDQFHAALPKGQTHLTRREAQLAQFFPNQFSLFDQNGDDKLTEAELLAYLDVQDRLAQAVACTSAVLVSEKGTGLFELLDRDRDGRLSQREVREAPRLLARLGREDAGFLSPNNIPASYQLAVGLGRGTFTRSGGSFSPRGMPTLTLDWSRPGLLWFTKMDRNHDGDLSPREFLGSRELFRKLDTDGDGLISLEEAEKADTLFRK
jgi:Ca2+-binding EF-hand superfamily protein